MVLVRRVASHGHTGGAQLPYVVLEDGGGGGAGPRLVIVERIPVASVDLPHGTEGGGWRGEESSHLSPGHRAVGAAHRVVRDGFSGGRGSAMVIPAAASLAIWASNGFRPRLRTIPPPASMELTTRRQELRFLTPVRGRPGVATMIGGPTLSGGGGGGGVSRGGGGGGRGEGGWVLAAVDGLDAWLMDVAIVVGVRAAGEEARRRAPRSHLRHLHGTGCDYEPSNSLCVTFHTHVPSIYPIRGMVTRGGGRGAGRAGTDLATPKRSAP